MARQLSGREIGLLVGLGIVGAIGYWYSQSGAPEAPPSTAAAKMAELGEPPVVHLERLQAAGEGYDRGARNLFAYYVPPPPPPPKRPAPVEVKAPPPMAQPAVQTAPQAPPAPRAPQPPRVPFQYIGYLGPKDARLAVFEQNGSIVLARIGEIVQEQFVVREFKFESVVIGYTDERFAEQTTELRQSSKRR